MSTRQLRDWLTTLELQRGIDRVLVHHTWKPDYRSFTGENHVALQTNMRKYHMETNGWADIGQHFSVFPDGLVVTGRSLEMDPACTRGANVGAVCIENVGNFDVDGDVMRPDHREAILETTAYLCARFQVPVDEEHVLYHHWFDLKTGIRIDGGGETKSCPGTNFFGGNTVEAAQSFFFPQVFLKIESE